MGKWVFAVSHFYESQFAIAALQVIVNLRIFSIYVWNHKCLCLMYHCYRIAQNFTKQCVSARENWKPPWIMQVKAVKTAGKQTFLKKKKLEAPNLLPNRIIYHQRFADIYGPGNCFHLKSGRKCLTNYRTTTSVIF